MSNTCGACGQITYSSKGEKGDPGVAGAAGANGAPGATGGQTQATIIANTGTVALTELQTGSKVVLDRLAGSIITLPDTPADGTNYEFITKTELTSNDYVINVGGAGLDVFRGFVKFSVGGSFDTLYTATSSTSITMNGTTTGGYIGTDFKTSYSATENIWYVTGDVRASGAVATPFN